MEEELVQISIWSLKKSIESTPGSTLSKELTSQMVLSTTSLPALIRHCFIEPLEQPENRLPFESTDRHSIVPYDAFVGFPAPPPHR